uniref:Uncharacterized protein n=1 Tax=Lactuca sativa TaxID=4236 RepID=A0A9R1VRZ7_LACSA|nr:hypothetical protein LSAT_V11C400189580 [Lactuca sativa]
MKCEREETFNTDNEIFNIDIFNYLKDFEKSGVINKGCNASFISLIPNKSDPLFIKDYRLIYLIGSYVEGGGILDGLLVINNLYSWAKKVKKRYLLILRRNLISQLDLFGFDHGKMEFGINGGIG